MPIGFIATFWPLLIAWLEILSLVLWRKPLGAAVYHHLFWLVLPTVALAIADIRIRGSLRPRIRTVFFGAGSGLALGLLILGAISWDHLSLLPCEWTDNCLSVDQWNGLKSLYSDSVAGLGLVVTGLGILGCLAWAVLLSYKWWGSRRSQKAA